MIVTYLYKQSESIKDDLKTEQAQANDFNHWSRTNECYFSFLELFLKSIAMTNPEKKIYLSLFNFSDKECDHFKSLNENLTIEKKKVNMNDWSKEDLFRAQSSNLLDLIEKKLLTNEKVIYVDVDCLIRGDIQEFYDILNDNDMTIRYRGYMPDKMKLNCGVMGYKGEKASRFIKGWKKLVADSDGFNWWTTQACLYQLFKKNIEKDFISFFDLPIKFHDMEFSNDSLIWHGNVLDKFKSLELFKKDFY